jgi:phage shock protein PspC (stress-responsive transcriptional regulator)
MFQRQTENSWVAGVAAGLAERYDVNVYLIRVLFVAAFLFFGLGLLAYWLLWVDQTSSRNQTGLNF